MTIIDEICRIKEGPRSLSGLQSGISSPPFEPPDFHGQFREKFGESEQPLKQRIEWLEQRLADYRWLFDTAEVATVLIDHGGSFLDCNQAYYRLMGHSEKTNFSTLHPADVSPDRQPDGKSSFEKANEMLDLAMTKRTHSFNWMHQRTDGYQLLSRVVLELVDFGGRNCIRGTIHDVSEVKKLERLVGERTRELRKKTNALSDTNRQLERNVLEMGFAKRQLETQADDLVAFANNEAKLRERLEKEINVKNTFFSIIAHDLRSPFTTLVSMTEVMNMMADTLSKETLVEQAGSLNAAAKKVFQLVENLLEWSRVQMEAVTIQPADIDVGELVNACFDLCQPAASKKGIALNNKIVDCRAWADPDMVQTVVRNLVDNALKFSLEGGEISISASRQRGTVEVSVADVGVGMSNKISRHVFELDHKTSTDGTAGEKGTGLGLPLCADLIEKNHGKIWVESEPGKGSTFSFTLPTTKELP